MFHYIRYGLNTFLFLCLLFFSFLVLFPNSPHTPLEGDSCLIVGNQNRQDLGKNICQSIDSAKESITLAIFGLSDKSVIQSLNKKAAEGISVRILYDPQGSKGLKKKLNTHIHSYPRHLKGHMHLKILIVDKKILWLGSANMTWESLHMHDNLMIALHHPSFASCVDSFLSSLIQRKEPSSSHFHTFFKDQELHLSFFPFYKHAIRDIIEIIDSCKHSLRIAMFTWTHPDLSEAVIRAHKRGVHVQVVIDYNSGRGASAQEVKRLHEQGVPTFLSSGMQLLHHKMMIVDQNTLVCGSANWTKSAFTKNDDCLLILSPLQEKQVQALNRIWRIVFLESNTKCKN